MRRRQDIAREIGGWKQRLENAERRSAELAARRELAEVVEDAWLAQASARRGRQYLEGPERIAD